MIKLTENEQKLMDVLIVYGDLTLPSLERFGLTTDEIRKMLMEGLIERIQRGAFALTDYSLLLIYAKELKEEGKLSKADKCLKAYEENSPANIARLMEIVYDVDRITSLNTKYLLEAGLKSREIDILYYRGLIKRVGQYFVIDYKNKNRVETRDDKKEKTDQSPAISKQETPKYLQILYEMIGAGKRLYKKNIQDQGIPINILLNQGLIVKEEKKGSYHLVFSLEVYYGMLDYADKCFHEGKIDSALNCLLNIYSYRPESTICQRITTYYIIKEDLKKAYEYIGKMPNDPNNKAFYNTLIYLFSFVFELKILEVNYTKQLTLTELVDPSSDDLDFEKGFKKSLLDQKFSKAQFLLRSKNKQENDVFIRALDRLLVSIIENQKKVETKIANFIKGSKYQELYALLTQENDRHSLSTTHRIYFSIVTDIVEKIDNGMTPIITTPRNDTLYEYIRTKNYQIAYFKWQEIVAKKGILPEKDYLGILLRQAALLFPNVDPVNPDKPSVEKVVIPVIQDGTTFTRFFNYLRSENIEGAMAIAKSVLENRGLSEFSYLVKAMIEQSILEKDKNFVKAVGTLRKLIKGSLFTDSTHKIIDIDGFINDINTLFGEYTFIPIDHAIEIIGLVNSHGHSAYTDEQIETIIERLKMRLEDNKKKYKI